MKQYEYDAVLHEMDDNGGAYVAFPWNIREESGWFCLLYHRRTEDDPEQTEQT